MKGINIKTGFSEKRNENEAVNEVFEQIKQDNLKFVIMFADGKYDQLKINQAWREKIPEEASFIGCSSLRVDLPLMRVNRNVTSQGFKKGLVAMGISSEKMDFSVKLIKNIKDNWKEESSRALENAAHDLNLDLNKADPKKYFGILLSDSLSQVENHILENLYSMSNLLFVGGGAAGKFNMVTAVKDPSNLFFRGYIHTKEGAFSDSAALALIKTEIPFRIDLTTSFFPTETKFKITKAKGRYIYELNGKPALDEYLRVLGISRISLGLRRLPNLRYFMKYPLGVMIKDRAYLRAIVAWKGKALVAGAAVKEGQTLCLMERGDIVDSTRKTMAFLKEKMDPISGMILFNCGYRLSEADIFKVSDDLFKAINIAPLIGLNSYGEYYGWLSMSNTLTILAFGDSSE